MYATLILSQSPYGVRQTAIVPTTSSSPRVFHRIGFGRGLAAQWLESASDASANSEYVLNAPVSVFMTEAHKRDADFMGRTPNNVLQALGKRVAESFVPTTQTLGDLYAEALNLTINNPAGLSKWAFAQVVNVITQPTPSQPVVQPVIQPVLQPVIAEPVAEPINYQAVVEPVVTAPSMPVTHAAKRETNVLTVPDVQVYYERVFNDISESVIYDKARANQWSVLLTGDAGTGKTSSARNYAATRSLPFVVIECTQQIDNSVTQGRFVPDEDGQSIKWVYSQLATAIQQPSVVLLNELTRMSPKSAALFLRLLAERELFVDTFNEVIKVHPDCIILADANIGGTYNGTMRQDGALLDRFAIKLNFTYDAELEKNFMPYPALLSFATSIRKAAELGEEDFSVPMSTRLLQNFVAHASNFNWRFAVDRLLANFPVDGGERDAVKMRLDSDAPRIAGEFGIILDNQPVVTDTL